MKLFVIGAEGQVGTFLRRTLAGRHVLSGTSMAGTPDLPALDIRDAEAVRAAIGTAAPDHVILTAAFTHVDGCENRPEEAEAVNVQGAANVARACADLGAGMSFFSSEYVFDGADGPYGEDDPPRPESVYGRTKLAGEVRVREVLPEALVIRTTVVYSYLPESLNFFMQLLARAPKGEIMTVPHDQIGNPTQAVNLAEALGELIENGHQGVFNLVGTTRLGRADFARRVVAALGCDPDLVKPVATADLRQKAPRPLNGGLRTDKAQGVLTAHRLWDLDQAIAFTLAQMGRERVAP